MSARKCDKHDKIFHYLESCPDCVQEDPEIHDEKYHHDLMISELARKLMELNKGNSK
jgi:hypothetical protein